MFSGPPDHHHPPGHHRQLGMFSGPPDHHPHHRQLYSGPPPMHHRGLADEDAPKDTDYFLFEN